MVSWSAQSLQQHHTVEEYSRPEQCTISGCRQKSSHNQPHAYEHSSPKHRKLGHQTDQFDAEQPFARAASGALPSGSARSTVADKVELAKQKIKAQGSANMGPSSRLAAAVAGPIKAKKRKVMFLCKHHDTMHACMHACKVCAQVLAEIVSARTLQHSSCACHLHACILIKTACIVQHGGHEQHSRPRAMLTRLQGGQRMPPPM